MFRRILGVLLLGVTVVTMFGCAAQQAGKEVRLIPVKEFFRDPEQSRFQLSPDGLHLAFMKPWEGRLNVYVQKIGEETASRDETKVLVRTYSDRSFGAYYYYDLNTDEFRKLVDVSPWLDESELAGMQPIEYVVQGANDPRVKKAESDQIVEALEERGIDVPYMVKDDEGHGFYNENNRFDFYGEMEKFLGWHLGGRVETAPEG